MTFKINRRTAVAMALAAPAILRSGRAMAAKELRVMAWDGYADDDWVKDFEQQTGSTVKLVFIGTDDEIWAKIKGSEGKDFDVFAVNTAQLQRYIEAGLTTPHNLDKLPNQKEVLPRFRDLSKVKGVMRDGKIHSIPFCFDSIGLIYNKDKVSTAPDSFEILWDPKYKGKVVAYDNGEHNFSFTALTLVIADPVHLRADQLQQLHDKLVWIDFVEDPTKRSDLWNEIKAQP